MINDIMNLYRHDLGSFLRFTFRELHPHTVYQDNWHIDLMAHYLEQVSRGKVRRLIINMPPRTLKSQCISVAWPAWELGRNPYKKILCLHASRALGRDLNDACLDLMTSRRYRALYPSTVIKPGNDRLRTSFSGRRQFMPIMARLTGLGADIIIIDDPISTADARDPQALKRLNDQFDDNILQRLNNKSSGAIVIVMQRVHEDDLTGHLLKKSGDWVHLNLPAIAVEDETWHLTHGRTYSRKKGKILQPERESREQLLEILKSVGGHAFAYQYLQGAYKPRFGETGHGCIWLNPQREGVFWDARTSPQRPFGFYHFEEKDLILPKIFGIGDDPCPPDMRNGLTMEEMKIACEFYRENMLEHQRKVASGELEF